MEFIWHKNPLSARWSLPWMISDSRRSWSSLGVASHRNTKYFVITQKLLQKRTKPEVGQAGDSIWKEVWITLQWSIQYRAQFQHYVNELKPIGHESCFSCHNNVCQLKHFCKCPVLLLHVSHIFRVLQSSLNFTPYAWAPNERDMSN